MSEPRPAADPELGDSDKLPWLEPYRERTARAGPPASPPTVAKAARPRRRGSGTALLGVVGALALGAGGYWFGRETAPREVITPQTTVIAALPPSPIPVRGDGELPYRSLDDLPNPLITAAPDESPRAAPPERAVDRARPTPRSQQVARAARETPPPPPPAPPPPKPLAVQPLAIQPLAAPVIAPPPVTVSTTASVSRPVPVVIHRNAKPSVGGPGEVIELGAFISRRTANAAFRRVARRYPYLGTRPKAVIAFPRSASWPPVYRLRLGTGSPRNARMLCRYVRSIGQRCAVV